MQGVEAPPRPAPERPSPGVLEFAAPLVVVGLAAGLWYLSDRLLFFGPLDRATFGWAVVVPIWALAPLAAGFAWRGLASRARLLAAVTCGARVAASLAAVLWQSVAFPDCQFGAARAPWEQLLPSITLGALVGGGFGLSTLAASAAVHARRPWRALLFGAAGQLAVVAASPILFFLLFVGVCGRP